MRTTKKRKKALWISVSILLVALIGIGAYGIKLYLSVQNALNTMQQPIEKSEKRDDEISIQKRDPFSVLLLGIDEREHDVGRTDTIIVATVNPEQNTIKMLSIPRDTRTEIIGNGTIEKINHAYARGGTQMSIATIEHFLDTYRLLRTSKLRRVPRNYRRLWWRNYRK